MTILSPKTVRFELRDPVLVSEWEVFVIFGNNLNGFWDFYHGTNVGAGAGSPKASKLPISLYIVLCQSTGKEPVLFCFGFWPVLVLVLILGTCIIDF